MKIIANIRNLDTGPYKIYYDLLMSFLAMSIVASLILQSRTNLTSGQLLILNYIDILIWAVFLVDYIVRFIVSENKKQFFRTNIIDLVSIIPFDTAFQGLRALRLARVLYMLRVFIYLNRVYKRLSAIVTTNDFHHVLWFTFSTIFCGAIAIAFVDDMDIGDALWWSFVTTTTVGYGDIAPHTIGGRIVAVVLMIVGIGFLSMLTGTVATFFITTQAKSSYSSEIVNQTINKLKDFDSLTIDDINNIHSVLLTLKQNERK
ncbi:hypothetical protein SRRS_43630 [Sporomusa rhizae]|uniref:potassium channel family protein n=1 Tax=Sporomusa rhizae TaxID=357999 RepID=UPI00352B9AC7